MGTPARRRAAARSSATSERVSDAAFVTAWYRAETVADFCRRTRLSRQRAHSRAANLRRGGGLPLPTLSRHDWPVLRRLVQRLAQERARRLARRGKP